MTDKNKNHDDTDINDINEEKEDNNNSIQVQHHHQQQQQNQHYCFLPLEVIMSSVLPYLERTTWNHLIATHKDFIIQKDEEAIISLALPSPPWPDQNRNVQLSIDNDNMAYCIAFSQKDNGRYLACGSYDGKILIWDNTTGKCHTLQTEEEEDNDDNFEDYDDEDEEEEYDETMTREDVRCILFPSSSSSPSSSDNSNNNNNNNNNDNSHSLIWVCNDGKVRQWDDFRVSEKEEEEEEVEVDPHQQNENDTTTTPIRQRRRQRRRCRLLGKINPYMSICENDKVSIIQQNGTTTTLLAIGKNLNRRVRRPICITLWNVETGICINQWNANTLNYSLQGMELSPTTHDDDDGEQYLVAIIDHRICLWELDKIIPRKRKKKTTTTKVGIQQPQRQHQQQSRTFNNQNNNMVNDTSLPLQQPPPNIPPTLIFKKHKSPVRTIAWSPPPPTTTTSSTYLVNNNDRNTNNGNDMKMPRLLACGLEDGSIWVWSIPDGKCLYKLGSTLSQQPQSLQKQQQPIYSLVFTPHISNTTISNNNNNNNNNEYDNSPKLKNDENDNDDDDHHHPSEEEKLSYMLVSGNERGCIGLWNLQNGSCISMTSNVHNDRIWVMAVTPNGQTVASYGTDGTIRFQHISSLPLSSSSSSTLDSNHIDGSSGGDTTTFVKTT